MGGAYTWRCVCGRGLHAEVCLWAGPGGRSASRGVSHRGPSCRGRIVPAAAGPFLAGSSPAGHGAQAVFPVLLVSGIPEGAPSGEAQGSSGRSVAPAPSPPSGSAHYHKIDPHFGPAVCAVFQAVSAGHVLVAQAPRDLNSYQESYCFFPQIVRSPWQPPGM